MISLRAIHRLEDGLPGRDNNLNLIRMLAASAVLGSHAFPITRGTGAEEPLEQLTGFWLGSISVCIFFGVSGLLITRSFDRSDGIVRFLVARVLRLFPGLLAVLIVTVAAGAAITRLSLPEYFSSPATWTYVPRNLSLAFLQMALPGVFETNPHPDAINGSLWTLFYEVVCYGGVVVAGVAGMLRSRAVFSAMFVMLTIAFVPKGALLAYNRLGDYSYGVYIFAYPIQQLLVFLTGMTHPATNMAYAFPLVLVCSVLSWHLIERRALSQVEPLSDFANGLLRGRRSTGSVTGSNP